ncbi:MAG: Ig-like domain-containing protein [Flavobacterium sp.]|nr:Ig-like domain-containing protein [Pedobacter sp.]
MKFFAICLLWPLLNYNVKANLPSKIITTNSSSNLSYSISNAKPNLKFAGCGTTSTLPCENIIVTLPYNLNFNQAQLNTITDINNQGTGFTMVDAYSGTRLAVDGMPSIPSVPGYEPSKLTLGNGLFQIVSNKGIAYLTNNNQLNALGVQFSSQAKFQVETEVINPFNGTSAQQAGIWIGQNDKTFLKLVVVGSKLEFRKEVNDVSVTADTKVSGVISGLNTKTVKLRIVVDSATNMANAFYSVDGNSYVFIGGSGLSITGMGLTGGTAFAGIFATHRNSSTPVTYTFDNFGISGIAAVPPPPPADCPPISPLSCTAIQVNLPVSLNFDQPKSNTITDINNQGIGFTMVDAYSGTRLAVDGTPSNVNVPGYEPSKLTLGNGHLKIISNKGIAYLTNNNQINSLGVQFNSQAKYQVETEVINPFIGTSAQQAGIWIGQNDKTFVKLVVVGSKLEFRKEVNNVSVNSTDTKVSGVISGLSTKTVKLRIVVDPATNIADAFYSIDGNPYTLVGGAGLSISGMALTGSTAFAGILATHRNSSTPVTYTFDNFGISAPIDETVDKKLFFSVNSLDFTVLKNGTLKSQTVQLTANVGAPVINFTNTDAPWFTLPTSQLGTITIANANINSNLPAGIYKVNLIASASGYQPVDLIINLTVIEPIPSREVTINFQNLNTIPPPLAFMDYGQPYGVRTTKYQDLNKTYGWKRRSDGTLLNLTKNGRNRLVPDDVLLATFMHMQANNISGTFTGTKTEGFWEYNTQNGEYDVTVSVGDANVNGADPESHTINTEGINIISGFVSVGSQGSETRFKTVTKRITVSDGTLTLNADGGINTKINSVKFKFVSPYIYWAKKTQNLLLEQNNPNSQTFSIGLGNSIDSNVTYNLSVDYGLTASGWLSFNTTHDSNLQNVVFNFSGANNLPVGIYSATVNANIAKFTASSFTIQLRVVDPNKPYVISSSPLNGTASISVNTVSIAANKLVVPAVIGFKGGVDNSTISNTSVKLLKLSNGNAVEITGVVQGTGGGDVISFSPSFGLEPNSTYMFMITDQVKSYSGDAFAPFESSFTTGALPTDSTNILNVRFNKIPVPGTQNKSYASLVIGPDDKFYALRLDGVIERYDINHADGSLTNVQLIETLINKYGLRSAIGIAFDPGSTATNLKIWLSHCSAGLTAAPEFDGNISLLSGPNLENERLVITRLPRSKRDHLVNSLAFGPDGALYFNQGSNSSLGDYDPLWQRLESLLSGAVLRLDMTKIFAIQWPLNVQTSTSQSVINSAPDNSKLMSDGTYNPYSSESPLTIYASGVRNAYDLVWHTNGQLYVPTNGSGGGGSSPVSVAGTRRPNGTFYNGPSIPPTTNAQVQPDLLFRVNPLKGVGFFGHPNPTRGEFVSFRGYLDNPLYPSSIVPDVNYRGTAYDFGLNISANGSIEYKSSAFGGRLKGKLIVCRFSGGGDLIVLEPGSMVKSPNVNTATDDDRIYNIIKAATGSGNNGIEGMSAFINPLDLTEDVQNGNLYVIEFNWNKDPNSTSQITLLQVNENAPVSSLNTIASSEEGIRQSNMISQMIENPSVKVYPNPVTGDQINFELKEYKPREDITVILYDMMGRVLKQAKFITNENGFLNSEFSLTNTQNNQYYIMKISSKSGSKMMKILVQ